MRFVLGLFVLVSCSEKPQWRTPEQEIIRLNEGGTADCYAKSSTRYRCTDGERGWNCTVEDGKHAFCEIISESETRPD